MKSTTRLSKEQQALVVRFLPLAHKLARKWARRNIKAAQFENDLFQAACFGLCEAATSFDPSKGAFSTHAFRRASWRVADAFITAQGVRRFGADRNVFVTETPTDFEAARHLHETTYIDEEAIDTEAVTSSYRRALGKKVGARNADVFFLYEFARGGNVRGDPFNGAAIGKKHGFSREAARLIHAKVKPVFEEWAAGVREEAA